MLPLSPAKKRYMVVSSAISAWSIGLDPPPREPLKSDWAEDHPFGFVGSLDVMYMNGLGPHS